MTTKRACSILLGILWFTLITKASEWPLWIAGSEGVEWCSLDSETGRLKKIHRASHHSLTWLAVQDHRFLYGGSVLPQAENQTDGALSSFQINKDHTLTFLNQVSALGKTTIYLALGPSKRTLFAANFRQDSYTSRGSMVSFGLQEDGTIGNNLQRFEHPGKGGSESNRQWASHPHAVVIDPSKQYAAVADLGIDKILIYRITPRAAGLRLVTEIAGLPGQQPRHLAWHPNNRFLYSMNEATPTVSVARFAPETGHGEFIQHIRRIQSKGGAGADIRIDSKGRFLYGTNRGENTIVSFEIHPDSGQLQLHGHTPTGGRSTRSIAISPDDRWLVAANQGDHLVKVFSIDPQSGDLMETDHTLQINQPACVLFAEPKSESKH